MIYLLFQSLISLTAAQVPSPEFSHPAGFFTNDLQLTLRSAPGIEIRFTLDGSEPGESSLKYSQPIFLTNRTAAPNTLSRIPTVPGHQPPEGQVFKGWVVRARSYKVGSAPGEIVTRSFFIHPQGGKRYSVPVISLATDSANFFDSRKGIYVYGRAPEGNYLQKGPDWERPVHIEFFETNGFTAFSQEGQVRIHGNTSPQFPIKGLDLNADTRGHQGYFRHAIFPDRPRREFDHVLLRPSGHDHHLAFMRDELTQSLAEDFGAETQASRLAVVFLNGEYWGLHYLKEKQNADYISHYSGLPKGDFDYLESYVEVRSGDARHYNEMLAFLRSHSLTNQDNFSRIRKMMDTDNYTDYKIAEIFNYRWDIGNHRLWRPRSSEGRWRWLQFDNDVSWGGFWTHPSAWTFDMLKADLTPSGSLYGHNDDQRTFLLRALMENKTFRERFIQRFAGLLNTVYEPARTLARVDRFASALEPEMAEHISRWRNPPSIQQWQSNVQLLRDFAAKRPENLRRQLSNYFKLSGLARLTLNVAGSENSAIQITNIRIPLNTKTNWTGQYFKGLPLTAAAVPGPGCRFVEWRGAARGAENPVEFTLTDGTELTAVFEPQTKGVTGEKTSDHARP